MDGPRVDRIRCRWTGLDQVRIINVLFCGIIHVASIKPGQCASSLFPDENGQDLVNNTMISRVCW
jgi:hypothetical protein